MTDIARARLSEATNIAVTVEDAQALSFSDCSFDAVLCSLGLMFFPYPSRGLSEFRRVLRPGGRAAVSVNTVVEHSYSAICTSSLSIVGTWNPGQVKRCKPRVSSMRSPLGALRKCIEIRSSWDRWTMTRVGRGRMTASDPV